MLQKIIINIFIIIIIIIIFFLLNKYLTIEHFAGNNFSEDLLNESLINISKILNDEKIDNWFIGYGTLLGIIRNDSCIDNDDDIDIMIDIKNINKIINIVNKYNFKFIIKDNNFLKISINDKLPTIDFYFCDVNHNQNTFNDIWEKILWTNCNPIIKKNWRNTILNIPFDSEIKLKNQYGDDWMTPIPGHKGEKRAFI